MKGLCTNPRVAAMLVALVCCSCALSLTAKEIVVVLNRNYTYSDPRWETSVTLKKGEAIRVNTMRGANWDFWPYPAANVEIPKRVAHIPGTVKGEKCIEITASDVPLYEKPSMKSNVMCINTASAASVFHAQFVPLSKLPKTDDWGIEAEWEKRTFEKGVKLPYKGKKGKFFKTEIAGTTYYIPASKARIK